MSESCRSSSQQIAGDVALAIANLLRASAIDIDVQLRHVERLLDAQVGRSRHILDLLHQLLGQIAVLSHCVADHLDIDWRRQAEVQDLAHHVRRQV